MESRISFPSPFPDVLEREADNTVRQEAWLAGQLQVPSSGTFELLDRNGTAVVAATPVVITDGVATHVILAAVLDDQVDLSPLYQERWVLIIDGVTYTVRREAAVARFKLYPVISDADLVLGEYPGLIDELGKSEQHAQRFLDEAWAQIMEKLWSVGRWPERMLSTSAFRALHKHWTYFLIFKYLWRLTAGASGGRWNRLMDHHKSEMNGAWSGLNSRIDRDLDGLPDEDSRESAQTMLHRGGGRHRRVPRSSRW